MTRLGQRADDNFIKVAGDLNIEGRHESACRVHDISGIAPTINTMQGGGLEPKILTQPLACASRGRNPQNPSDRTAGIETEQRLEVNYSGVSNTITSVQKDNLVLVPQADGVYLEQSESFTCPPLVGMSRTLRANSHDAGVITNDRIRKLTPLECFRLMGFTDDDFHKARLALMEQCYNGKDRTASSLYKQAGNSIVVTVPMAIFRQLFKLDGYQGKKNN